MGTTAGSMSTRRRPVRPKYVAFALIALMMLVVLDKDRVIADPADPIWDHYRTFKWWLIPHGIAGILVLLLGASQFSDRLRRRLPRHRLVGRLYVGAVAVTVPIGILIESIKLANGIAPVRLLVATSCFGALFALTTATGFAMARRHDIVAHRRWMTRSYAIGLVFLTGRTVDHIPSLASLMARPDDMLEAHHVSGLWLYVLLSLVMAEVALAWFGPARRTTGPHKRA